MEKIDREKIMKKWDSWTKYYRESGRASWPRDAFESLLDELLEKNKVLKEDLSFWQD